MRYEDDANDSYGYPPSRPPRRRLVALGCAVAGTVAFAGFILSTYSRGGQTATDGGPPVIQAETAPTKLRPEQPGGIDVPHQDKLVYEHLTHSDKEGRPQVEHLLPPPEQPLPRPVVSAIPEQPAAVASTGHALRDDGPPAGASPPPVQAQAALPPALPPTGQSSEVAALPSAPPRPRTPAPAPVAVPRSPAPPPAAVPAPRASSPPPAQAAPQAAPIVAAPKPIPPPSAAPSNATPSGGSGGFRIQLASLRSETEAQTEWKRIAGRYPGVVGGLSMHISKADLGEKGIFYRVQGGGVDEARAKTICAQLNAQKVGCVVVRP